jgi:AAA+ ATPase superfamily predicted ATPase
MQNPFYYGSVVKEDSFCNRKKELMDIIRAIQNSEKLFIYSERRFGKTSLVRLALEKLPKKEYICIYVDLWPTDGELSFITILAKAIAESISTTADKLLDITKSLFNRLIPTVTIDEEGKPTVIFGLSKSTKTGLELDEVLNAPHKIIKERKQKVVVVFDEFQQILEYGSDMLERKLRSIIQTQQEISYIFLGSKKHLIQKMFLDKSRPLYRSGGHYPLKPIDKKDWLPFLQKKFSDVGNKQITDEQVFAICKLTEGHPFYTQYLSHVLWELCEENNKVTDEMIKSAVNTLLERENYAYTTLWESLSINQRRLLKGLASEEIGVKPFASDFFQKYNIASASTTQRAIKSLLEKDIIDKDNGSFVIVDRFFKLWIQKVQLA